MSDERARKVAQLAEQARQLCWEIERLFGKGEHLAAAEELYMVLNGLSRHFAEPAPPTTGKVASEVGEAGAREFVESWLKERIGGPGWWPITRQETSSLLCSFYADVARTHREREERLRRMIRLLCERFGYMGEMMFSPEDWAAIRKEVEG